MNLKAMQEQWQEFCKKNKINNPLQYFEEIKSQHSKPKRYYHTFDGHVAQGLEVFQEFKHLCENPDLVYYSWILHDSIYDTKAKDNEEESAGLAYQLAIKMGFPYKFAKASSDLVLITKHIQLPKTTDKKIIVDIDLSIFGKPEEIFDEYEKNTRKEYSWVPEKIYRTERSKILQMFLNREYIYLTDFFRHKYEQKARENLKRSLRSLKTFQ